MGLTVHHLQVSQSERVVWLCEELGLQYSLKLYARHPFLAPPEYSALHPIGAAPVIEDDDAATGRHITLAESEACVEYINQIHGGGRLAVPPGAPNYADYLYWFAFVNGTLQPAAGRGMALKMSGVPAEDATRARYEAKVEQCLAFVEQRLGQVPFLAGDALTTADIMAVFTLATMRKFFAIDHSPRPNTVAYLKRISQREAYRRALTKGDPELDIDEITAAQSPKPFEPKQKS